jgi:hypothetical protein
MHSPGDSRSAFGTRESDTVVLLPGGRPRLAANMLIWTKGTFTLRLEGAASLKQALAIAETLE